MQSHSLTQRARPPTARRAFAPRWIAAVVLSFLASGPVSVAQVTPAGSLANFDVRYVPGTLPGGGTVLPNDLDIFLYGDNLSCNDVISTWNTDILLGGRGLQWGRATCEGPEINPDPNSPGFGLDCIRIRYSGPERPQMVNQLVHAGVQLRPGTQIEHQEIWWTFNGTRLGRPCDPHIRWVWNTRTLSWIVCIANPTPNNLYIYGYRWFLPWPTVTGTPPPMPTLNDLLTDADPGRFGAQWESVREIGPGVVIPRIICIPPWCRTYIRIRIPITICRPIIFQVAVAAQDIANPPDFPDPLDERTMMIVTTRPTVQPPGDINGDGATGVADIAELRLGFGQVSEDLDPPQDSTPGDNRFLPSPVGPVPSASSSRRGSR